MISNADLLRDAKSRIARGDLKGAVPSLEKLLRLLKMDYDNNINRVQSGKAFNSLLQVRKECLAGHLSDASYALLKLPVPKKAESEPKQDDDFWTIKKDDSKAEDQIAPTPDPKKEEDSHQPRKEEKETTPEEDILNGDVGAQQTTQFRWDSIPTVTFDDIAGLDECKAMVERKVLLPLLHPEMMEGYVNNGGGGVCLYGPPGTGKTMISAAIANRIGAKFCSITPSDLLQQGLGNTEKAVKALFAEARSFPCSLIYFDEMDSIAPKNTKSTAARQLRSEFLAQLQGVQAYGKQNGNILFLICATNKPWDIDSAFLRPGRFGTLIYVGLPDDEARRYIVTHRLDKIREKGQVDVRDDIDIDEVVTKTKGFNCADVSNLMNFVEETSVYRAFKTKEKYIDNEDFFLALRKVHSTVQASDIEKLDEWRKENDAPLAGDEEEEEIIPIADLANQEPSEDDKDFEFEDTSLAVLNIAGDGVVVTKYRGTAAEVNVPSTHDGKPVVAIGPKAFVQNKDVVSVHLSEGIRLVGGFYGCSSLKEINLPSSVAVIAKEAFSQCLALEKLSLPAGLKDIGELAFYMCSAEISSESPLYRIDEAGVLFDRHQSRLIRYPLLSKAESYAVPSSVNEIDPFAFAHCDSLKEITLPEELSRIGQRAFEGCAFPTIRIPSGVEFIASEAFAHDGLTIVCDVPTKPDGWADDWNVGAEVVWGGSASDDFFKDLPPLD